MLTILEMNGITLTTTSYDSGEYQITTSVETSDFDDITDAIDFGFNHISGDEIRNPPVDWSECSRGEYKAISNWIADW
jgi:hypothetical protein